MINITRRIPAWMIAMVCALLWTCQQDESLVPDKIRQVDNSTTSEDVAGNDCESQNYHAKGTSLTVKDKVCAADPASAQAMMTIDKIAKAVLKRFNIDQSLCAGHNCNNAEKSCQIGNPKGTLNVTSIVCVPTNNTEACEMPLMEFECTMVLSNYTVNVKCGCQTTN